MSEIPQSRFCEGADYRQALAAIAAALWMLVAQGAGAQVPDFTGDVEERVLALTNDLRVKSGIAPLASESRLTDTARSFAHYIASTGRLDHDADGTTPADRVKKRGYTYCMVAENLAFEYSSAGFTPDRLSRNFFEHWAESPTHRGNMLQPELTQIGVGVARNRSGEYYAVQVFGRPLAQMTRFRVLNRANATVRYQYRNSSVTLGPKQGRNHESCVAGTVKLDSSGQEILLQPRDGGRYAITEVGRGVYRITDE
ncbi:MAG TPA: CAP domain-containing protein [Burkholderiales bacterium]|nr:CAP domain-containing protein [Burkholderiales bacterium]